MKFTRDKVMKLAKDIVKNRDKVCQVCGKKPPNKLDCHHILDERYLPFDTDNLILLCPSHHKMGFESFHNNPLWAYEWLRYYKHSVYNKLRTFKYTKPTKPKKWDYAAEYKKLLEQK